MATDLLDELAALTRAHPTPFVSAPIVEANDDFFPEPYTPSAEGVVGLASCLLVYAGLETLSVEVALDPLALGERTMLQTTRLDLAGVEGDVVHLSCTKLGGIETALPALVQEIARAAWLLRDRRDSPYRSAPKPGLLTPDDDDAERRAGSLFAFVLGFGWLALEGSHRYRQAGDVRGRQIVTEWVHQAYGALSPDEAARVFAAQLCVRGYDPKRVDALLGPLAEQHRLSVRAILPELDRAALIDRLGLPSPAKWPKE